MQQSMKMNTCSTTLGFVMACIALMQQEANGFKAFHQVAIPSRRASSSTMAFSGMNSRSPQSSRMNSALRASVDVEADSSRKSLEKNSRIAQMNAMAAQIRAEAAVMEADLKSENAKKLAVIFEQFDTNRDGAITPQELRDGIANVLKSSISEEQARRVVAEFDASGDGAIQFAEFFGVDAIRMKLDKVLRQEKQEAMEARRAAVMAQESAKKISEQAKAIAELVNNEPPSAADKFIATLPYILPLADVLPYARFLILGSGLDQNPIIASLGLFLATFNSIPFAGFIAFFLFNTLVANLKINRLVRFNLQQAIYLDIALFFPSLLGTIYAVLANYTHLTLPDGVVIGATSATFLAVFGAVLYSVVSSLSGSLPDGVPFISQRALGSVPSTEELVGLFEKLVDEDGNIRPPPAGPMGGNRPGSSRLFGRDSTQEKEEGNDRKKGDKK